HERSHETETQTRCAPGEPPLVLQEDSWQCHRQREGLAKELERRPGSRGRLSLRRVRCVTRVRAVGTGLLWISRGTVCRIAGLARLSRRSARVLVRLGIGLGGIVLRTVALGRLLPLRIAGWGIRRLRRRQWVAAIRAGLGARLVPGGAAIRARRRLVGLHSCAAALPMQLGAHREPFGATPTLPSPASGGGK